MNAPFHILHVDDSPFDRQLVRDALELEHNQFIVTTAASRQEFETRLAAGGYDLVLTDFNILGFEGLQVIDAVHEALPSLPVIVLTGTGSEEVAVEAMKRGAADYVIKNPHHIRRLPMAIQSAIERKRLRDERLRSEQALRVSEERLRAFANALPDLAFIVDETGHYVQLLSASEHLLYQEGERYLGKRVEETLPEPIAGQIKAAIHQAVRTGAVQTIEYQLDLHGRPTWFEGRFSLMADVPGEQALVVYVARDITDHKHAEIKLMQERNLLRTLIDNAPDYIYVINHAGRFIASNAAHAAAAHLLPPQMIGKSAVDVFPPGLAHQFHGDDEALMAAGFPVINEERLVEDAYGNEQWVLITKVPLHSEHGDVTGLVGIARDITFRKRAEEALQESEEYLQAVVSGTPVILFVLDTEGRLTLLQGQGLSAFPDDLEVLVGQSILETLEAFIPDIRERFQQALTGEETGSIQTIGDVILDVRYSPMRNKAGEISGIIGIATDITERLKTERLQIELEKEQEMIALKERFIATASHDFRTPLAVMKMSASMLERYFDRYSKEERLESLNQIITQIDRMTRLLDDVLTMSKASAGKLDFKPEPVALRRFCEQIWDNFRRMAEGTHILELVYHCNWDQVVLDPNLIHYILVNLLSNAIKYSPVNGYVRFEVQCEGDNLIFRVSDNGIGIPEEDQAKLFEPFYRATNTGEIDGTGLGLSIVKSYVEAHHGQIVFESEEGRGTTFTVSIPTGRF
jgi:PAS domain S-box-containing protein